MSSFVHFGYQHLIRYVTCKYFLVYNRLPFDCDGISFIVQMPFKFDVVPFVYFCLCFPCLGRHIQKILLKPMPKGIMPIFSSRRLVVLHFTFKIFIHFEFIFVHGLRKQSSLILFSHSCPVISTLFIEEAVFFPLYILASFVID